MTTNPRRKHPADHHAPSATDHAPAEPGPTGRGMLRTYAVAVVLTCLLTVLVTVVVAGRAPTAYTSTATVLIESTSTNAGVGEPMMGNEKQVAESGRVAEIAAERLGLHGSAREGLSQGLAVTVPVDTTVLRIGYTSTDPGVAYARAVAFSDAYMDYRNSQKIPQVARLVSAPSENDEGSGRGLGLLVAVGLLAGAALGVCLAWAWDRLRDRFRTLADLERHSGAPVLGRVPRLGDDLDIPWSGPKTRRAFSHVAVRLLTGLGNPRRGVMVLVASPRPAAGTTTVAFELATSLAGMGRTVVVMDARPGPGGLGDLLDRADCPGLSDVLVSGAHVDKVVVSTPVQRLTLVPPGSVIADGHMDVDALGGAVTRLAMRAIVVVDGPPLLEDAAAVVLADRADAVLLVADESKGTRSDARAAVQLLGDAAERLSGWVVNRPAGPHWRRIVPRRRRRTGERPALDGAPDTAPNAGSDAGSDAGTDAGSDAGSDAGPDAGGPVPQNAVDHG